MNDFIKELEKLYRYEIVEGGIILYTSIMYQGADHYFSFCIKQNAQTDFIITDQGQTWDYLRENLNPNKYLNKIKKICEYFEIELSNGEFIGKLASLESKQTMRNLFGFIGAMNMIAYIDVLDE